MRHNGRVYEWIAARMAGRRPCDLYHSALVVRLPDASFVIEQAPAGRGPADRRGVVAVGPVGARGAGRLRLFRYELRCWRNGVVPDLAHAVDSPQRVTSDLRVARRLLELAPATPTATWGRDELGTGEMWNSNSVVSWLLVRAGVDVTSVQPPTGGRAPGWAAGLTVARRVAVPATTTRSRG